MILIIINIVVVVLLLIIIITIIILATYVNVWMLSISFSIVDAINTLCIQ